MRIGSLFRFAVFVVLAAAVSMQPAEAAKKKRFARSSAPAAERYADLVIDATTGKVLHQTNANALRHPASLTKMMTLYMTFAALESGKLTLNQRMYVSSLAASQSPSRLGLQTGERLRVEDAILGLVTESANDAAVVLAETIGGSEPRFAMQMTETARKLGMNSTVFKNASGLPNKQQVTTARDMAKLGLALLRHYPQYYPYFSTAGFEYEGGYHNNHNRLMARYEGMDGIKTGFVQASGFNLVASAMRDGRRLVGVVFGGKSAVTRDNQMAGLLNASFDKAKQLARTEVASAAIPQSATPASFAAPAPDRKPQELMTAEANVPAKAAATARVIQANAIMDDSQLTDPAVVGQGDAQEITNAMPKDGWGIQIGAYNDRPSGQRALAIVADRYRDLFTKASARVIAVDSSSGTIFRARLVGMDQNNAAKACERLQKANHSCLMLPPVGAPPAWLASAQ